MDAEKKIIFLDIDGTFTIPLEKPTPLAERAVRMARANGHKVFLCTGRNMPIISKDILGVGFDGVVASAGSHVEVDGKVIFDSIMPEETVQECISVFHQCGVYCRIETPEGFYVDGELESLVRHAVPGSSSSELLRMKKELETGVGVRSYAEYPRNGAYKVCFLCTDLHDVERTKKMLSDRFTYVIHPYDEGSPIINGEIIRIGLDKGSGMRQVCGYYGADIKNTIAFGDSMNDYDMFRCAGTSVAMGNACEELKQAADRICEPVEDDGVYYEFQRLHLI